MGTFRPSCVPGRFRAQKVFVGGSYAVGSGILLSDSSDVHCRVQGWFYEEGYATLKLKLSGGPRRGGLGLRAASRVDAKVAPRSRRPPTPASGRPGLQQA